MKFNTIIGTGGIGSGVIYRLKGNHTLGREESRLAELLNQKDFCKLHISLHYPAVLAQNLKIPLSIFPIASVGNDLAGKALINQMKKSGLICTHVKEKKYKKTLFSNCFQYPDGTGGNITLIDSASDFVSKSQISTSLKKILKKGLGRRCIFLSCPEVPLQARIHLIELGKKAGGFTAGVFLSEELRNPKFFVFIKLLDLIILNKDETAALANTPAKTIFLENVETCLKRIQKLNKNIAVVFTNGKKGVIGAQGKSKEILKGLKVKTLNSAGAGDCLTGSLLLGLSLGLPLISNTGVSALRLARLIAAFSVTAKDTIHFGLNLNRIINFARQQNQTQIINFLKNFRKT